MKINNIYTIYIFDCQIIRRFYVNKKCKIWRTRNIHVLQQQWRYMKCLLMKIIWGRTDERELSFACLSRSDSHRSSPSAFASVLKLARLTWVSDTTPLECSISSSSNGGHATELWGASAPHWSCHFVVPIPRDRWRILWPLAHKSPVHLSLTMTLIIQRQLSGK